MLYKLIIKVNNYKSLTNIIISVYNRKFNSQLYDITKSKFKISTIIIKHFLFILLIFLFYFKYFLN